MDQLILAVINFMGGGILLCIGIYLRFATDSAWLIAGYNSMDKKERIPWNEPAMRRFLGNVFMLSSSVIVIAGVLALLGFHPIPITISSWAVFVAILIPSVIYLNKSPTFRV